LVRFGTSVGDLTLDYDAEGNGGASLDSAAPIWGVGARMVALHGHRIPAVSVAGGASRFTERSIRVSGFEEGTPFAIGLDYHQSSGFLVGEVAERWGPIGAHFGTGATWQVYDADLRADVVLAGGGSDDRETIERSNTIRRRLDQWFAGIELGADTMTVVMEAGTSDGAGYGSFFVRITPGRGGKR